MNISKKNLFLAINQNNISTIPHNMYHFNIKIMQLSLLMYTLLGKRNKNKSRRKIYLQLSFRGQRKNLFDNFKINQVRNAISYLKVLYIYFFFSLRKIIDIVSTMIMIISFLIFNIIILKIISQIKYKMQTPR